MRKLRKIEAFRSGAAKKMIPKMINVLGRRVGTKFTVSESPYVFKNSEGTFEGYWASFDKGVIRINVKLDKADRIYSVDYFTQPSVTPTYTIDLLGNNVVQVLDMIADVLTGEYFRYAESYRKSKRMREARRRMTDFIGEWLDQTPAAKDDIQSGSVRYEDLFNQFSSWMTDNRYTPPAGLPNFKYHLNRYIRENNMAGNVPVVQVRRGQSSQTVVNPQEAEIFEDEVVENEHLVKFDMMEHLLRMMAQENDRVTAMFIYGVGGIGKTKTVRDVLEEEGVWDTKVVARSGAIAGFTGLLQLFYDNRSDKIIVLDDNDDILKNQNATNILKAALDSDNPRTISYTKVRRRGESVELNELDLSDFESDEGVEGGQIPESFEFTSRVVFISNYTKIPQAVGDRTWSIELNLTKEQIVQLIESRLANVLSDDPSITIEDKKFVLDFMRENTRVARKVSFRQFMFLTTLYKSMTDRIDTWKQWAKILMKSGADSM